MGIRAFILSGYPHLDECELFAKHVLPRLDTVKLNEAQGRLPKETPETPLTFAPAVNSPQNLADDPRLFHSGEALIEALEPVGQLLVIDP